jgi:hypothetical protein
VVYQDPPDNLRCDREEVGAIAPVGPRLINKAQIRFVNDRRGLKRVARLFAAHVSMGDPV